MPWADNSPFDAIVRFLATALGIVDPIIIANELMSCPYVSIIFSFVQGFSLSSTTVLFAA